MAAEAPVVADVVKFHGGSFSVGTFWDGFAVAICLWVLWLLLKRDRRSDDDDSS